MKDYKYTLYRHVAPNGKMYVGITSKKPEYRWENGNGYKANQHFTRAIQKYGWDNFKHEILLTNLSEEDAKLAEELCILSWDLMNPEKGYNKNSGGTINVHVSDDTKKKISQAMKERWKSDTYRAWFIDIHTGEKNHMYGKHHTTETKLELSKKLSGKNSPRYGTHLTNEQKKAISNNAKPKRPVVQLSKEDNKVIESFESIHDAARKHNINPSHIWRCCTGKRKSTGGYRWMYKEDYEG